MNNLYMKMYISVYCTKVSKISLLEYYAHKIVYMQLLNTIKSDINGFFQCHANAIIETKLRYAIDQYTF